MAQAEASIYSNSEGLDEGSSSSWSSFLEASFEASNSSSIEIIEEVSMAEDEPSPSKRPRIEAPSRSSSVQGFDYEFVLSTLFVLRGIAANYDFELAKNKPMGGKFDDIVFRYYVKDGTSGKHWRYRCVQAKHSNQPKDKITACNLLGKKNKDYSLRKYFRSYCRMIWRGDDIENCVICTNIGFSKTLVGKKIRRDKKIVLVPYDEPDEFLTFDKAQSEVKSPGRYKFELTEELKKEIIDNWQSDIQILANTLKKRKNLNLKDEIFQIYHVALAEEVIDLDTMEFRTDFINNTWFLSHGARDLRDILERNNSDWKKWKFTKSKDFGIQKCEKIDPLPKEVTEEDINGFFNKIIFVVKTPNQDQFKEILQTRDVSKYYSAKESEKQTIEILYNVRDWFNNNCKVSQSGKEPESDWFNAENGKTFLLSGINAFSITYQKELRKDLEFNQEVIQDMADDLRRLLESSEYVLSIVTEWTEFTAVKVITSLKTMTEYNKPDSFLVISSNHLGENEDKQRWKNIMELKKDFPKNLLIIVCDANDTGFDVAYDSLFSYDATERMKNKNKILVIQNDGVGMKDNPSFNNLSFQFQEKFLRENTVSFQGRDLTVGDLIEEDKLIEIIDLSSMKELMRGNKVSNKGSGISVDRRQRVTGSGGLSPGLFFFFFFFFSFFSFFSPFFPFFPFFFLMGSQSSRSRHDPVTIPY